MSTDLRAEREWESVVTGTDHLARVMILLARRLAGDLRFEVLARDGICARVATSGTAELGATRVEAGAG